MQPENRDARLFATIAFLTLLFPVWGGIAALLIWLTQRRDLPYASFHAAEATVVHLLVFALLIVAGTSLVVVPWVLGRDPAAQFGTLMAFSLGLVGVSVLVGLLGAIQAWRSGFRIPGVARLVGNT